MNFSNPGFWLDAAQCLVLIGLSVLTWVRRPGAEAKAALAQLSTKIDSDQKATALRIQRLEDAIAHMPTDQEMEGLRGDVQEVRTALEGQRELLKRVEHQQSLILEQLLNRR